MRAIMCAISFPILRIYPLDNRVMLCCRRPVRLCRMIGRRDPFPAAVVLRDKAQFIHRNFGGIRAARALIPIATRVEPGIVLAERFHLETGELQPCRSDGAGLADGEREAPD